MVNPIENHRYVSWFSKFKRQWPRHTWQTFCAELKAERQLPSRATAEP